MKRLLRSESRADEATFAPIISFTFFDDETFQLYDAVYKISAEFSQELNAMNLLTLEAEDRVLSTIIEHYQKIKLETLDDYDLESLEDKMIEMLNSDFVLDSYKVFYLNRLENIKVYRRDKNLNDLGI